MESNIKVKATSENMEMFFKLYCVKRFSRIKWLNDGKNRWLYDVTLRHADNAGKLRGTFTVETLMKRFREDAYTNLPGLVRSSVKDANRILSLLGEHERFEKVLNDALQEYGMKVCKAA